MKSKLKNPFVTMGYVSGEYFCDREKESETLFRYLSNGQNVVLTAPRRMGKTGLIHHCIQKYDLGKAYDVIVLDIYSAQNLYDFTLLLGNAVLKSTESFGEKALSKFLQIVSSLSLVADSGPMSQVTYKLQYSNLPEPEMTLEQIFAYLKHSRKPCLIAIDEFQQISYFPEHNVEALLRTYVQTMPESRFIFSGSQRRMLSEMFNNANRPFFQSTTPMSLESIDKSVYITFCQRKFDDYGKVLDDAVAGAVYDLFDGITWYVQKVMNEMFMLTSKGSECERNTFELALSNIMQSYDYIFEEEMFKMPQRQRTLLIAMAKSGKVSSFLSEKFASQSGMTPSSIQAAKRGLLGKDYITETLGVCQISNKFLELWIKEKM